MEAAKLMAETAKLNRESAWLPFAAGGAFVAAVGGAMAAIVKLFL